MGGRGGRPVQEGAKGIVWAATLPNDGPTEDFSLTVSLLHGKINLFWIILWLDGVPEQVHVLYQPYF
jgi:hypothetical protein